MRLEFICENDEIRITEELKKHLSKRMYRHLKGYNIDIYINGEKKETFEFINKGDVITFDYDIEKEVEWPLYESKIDVLFECDNYLIVNKPSGLLTIPTKCNPKSLYQEVLFYLKSKNDDSNISILNRLDKDTSGLLMVAKNPYFTNLMSPIHSKMERRYLALCHGIFDEKVGRIENKIRRSDDSNKRIISNDGQIAITNYKVIEEYDNLSLVEFVLETGRTHQIRLHASSINHPICGDDLYGTFDDFDRLCLHSYYMKFTDPLTLELKEFKKEIDFFGRA